MPLVFGREIWYDYLSYRRFSHVNRESRRNDGRAIAARIGSPRRRQAVQLSVKEKLERMRKRRLAEECAKLNPKEEKALAEEGMAEDFRSWPEY
jgi:hypothetical protein